MNEKERAIGAAVPSATNEEIRTEYERGYTGANQTCLSWSAFRGGWRACERRRAAGVAVDADTSHMNCLEARRIDRAYAICKPCNTGFPEHCLYKRPKAALGVAPARPVGYLTERGQFYASLTAMPKHEHAKARPLVFADGVDLPDGAQR